MKILSFVKSNILKYFLQNKEILLLVLLFSIIYSLISFQKHMHFQTFGWDTSFFVQSTYFASQFKEPYNSLNKMNVLGDHFALTTVVFGAILYRIWSEPLVLFILQAVTGSFSGLFLFLLTKINLGKTKISSSAILYLSLSVTFLYLFSVSFQAMMADEYHNEPMAALFITAMFYYLYKKNNLGYWIFFILFLLTKEIFSLLAIPLGIYIGLSLKDYKKGLITSLIGILIFYLLIYQFMPYLAGQGEYLHFAEGNQPNYIFTKLIQNPSLFITEFFDHPEKIKTIWVGFLTLSFLPILSPISLLMPAASLALRFYDDTSVRLYVFNNHYTVPFTAFMAIAASFGLVNLINFLQKLKKINFHKNWIILLVIFGFVGIFQDYLFKGPMNSLVKTSFYEYQDWQIDAHQLIKSVPDKVEIASQNSLLPHLSERDNIYLLPEIGGAEYIVVDLSEGPNKFAPLQNAAEMESIINKEIEEKRFKIIWKKNKSILLKKI